MRWIGAVVCTVLLTGSIEAQQSPTRNAGESQAINVIALFQTVASCHLTTPEHQTLDFVPGVPTEFGDKYEILDVDPNMPSCSVVVKNLEESDSGIWELVLRNDAGVESSTKIDLTVLPRAEEDEIDDHIRWLNPIEFPTRVGQNVDISLSKTAYPEECYIRKPDGLKLMTADINTEDAVTTVHDSSDFVSCRVTIGPMDDTLLGDWALCGRRTDNSTEQDRCQLVKITWHNNNSPHYIWSTNTQGLFNHVVNLGGTLTPVVLGHSSRVTCHIITNNDEDLVIDADSNYPNLRLASSGSHTCSVAIGPITESMLGNWTLYGKFRDFTGLSEVRLPMNLFLYDVDNPYDQAYNVSENNLVKRVVNLDSTVNIEVVSTGKVDSCEATTPSGETINLDNPSHDGASFVDVGEGIACRITIGQLTISHLGQWTVIGKFSNNGRYTEERQTFELLEEDPENPLIDEDRSVQNMTQQRVTTDIGKSQRIIIHSSVFIVGESCHIRTPAGLQYTFMDGFNVEGVEIIKAEGVECGVLVHVLSEDAVGTWTLIARATQSSQLIERRLPFTIIVEENVEAMPKEVTILEGNDLHVRLALPTSRFYDTCKIVAPPGAVSSPAVDPLHIQSCGYTITNISNADTGIWEITYGSKISYRAEIVVNVSSGHMDWTSFVDLTLDEAVNQTVGPESVVYCRLEDPQGVTVFDDFGRCILALDKVTSSHKGTWKMVVVSAGKVVAVEHQLLVDVKEGEGKPQVVTRVDQAKPIVTMSCSVATDAAVHACKFRGPQGTLLLATPGLAEDRYAFHGSGSSLQSGIMTYECGLQITDPRTSDLGLWRCAIETEADTHYGFLSVLCPWALMDATVAATVQQEPILTSEKSSLSAVEDEPVTMSCTVDAAIRYCYFRAQNGTNFAVYPGLSTSDMEYVGAGLDAGECGVRFNSLRRGDSGLWGCHVGLAKNETEQRRQFDVDVQEAMSVNHFIERDSTMFVEGKVHDSRALEYCRFVRIDGLGFTSDSIPDGYLFSGNLENGICKLTISHPTILDRHPWTVVSKIRGQDREISRDTMEAILITPPAPNPDHHEPGIPGGRSSFSLFLFVFITVLLLSIVMVSLLGPKKNRKWTYSRASALRSSLQSSIRKQPLPPQAPINQA